MDSFVCAFAALFTGAAALDRFDKHPEQPEAAWFLAIVTCILLLGAVVTWVWGDDK